MRQLYLFLGLLACVFFVKAQSNPHRINLDPTMAPFYHGVESGDPEPDHVIIWTRVTPDTGVTGNIDVYWQVATDVNFTRVINYGKTVATDSSHYCAKVDVCGLQPSTYYYYMFNSGGRNSIIGRTKTAPAASADVDSVRFAVVSCASFEQGYFNAYQSISTRNDVDAVVHVGDYIYEEASGGYSANISGRTYDPPTECITELGYELRYSQYKLDDQLRRIHQLYPFITVWDDHETANNSWSEGAPAHDPNTDGPFDWRKYNSTTTYFNWMPIRKPDPNDTIRIFRKLRYGKLLDLIMLDTRLYDRSKQNLAATDDTTQHIMGPVERAWFLQQLDDTTTRWKIVGNQVMFAPLKVLGVAVNNDQWDGYDYERTLIENHILQKPVNNVVILTGDIHTSWCNDVPGQNYNSSNGDGSVCVEFVGTSITSPNFPIGVSQSIVQAFNSHVKYCDLSRHGYYILDVKKNRTQADYTFVSTISQLGSTDVDGTHFYVNSGERHLRQASGAIPSTPITAANPPLNADQSIPFTMIGNKYATLAENGHISVNIIPSLNVCPAVSMQNGGAQHGFAISLDGQNVTYTPGQNFFGNDTAVFYICTTDTPAVCDTVYLYLTVTEHVDIDTFEVNVQADSTVSGCLNFDELLAHPNAVNNTIPLYGSITYSDTCFSYTADSVYFMVDTVVFTACDTTGRCDTVVYIFHVGHLPTTSDMYVQLDENTHTVVCLDFAALHYPHSTAHVLQGAANGTYHWVNDSCFTFYPNYNYTGYDTMQFVACDSPGMVHCDTITVYFTVNEVTGVSTNNIVVFEMYPNPVEDKMLVQYYLYQNEVIYINVYDITGKVVFTKGVSHVDYGLQHAEINTSQLAPGNYIVELKSKTGFYRKKIIKQ